MKTALVILSLTLASFAQAKSVPNAPTIHLPSTAVEITSAAEAYAKDADLPNARQVVIAQLRRADTVDKSPASLDIQCAAIYRVWTTTTEHGYWDLVAHEYCQPRDLQQMQIGSLYRQCQEKPSPQCYQKDYLEYLKAYQMTQYFDVN